MFVAASILLALEGCEPARRAVPKDLAATTEVPGFAGDKFWADVPSPSYEAAIGAKDEQLRQAVETGQLPKSNLTHADFLAISGGDDQGAFAAGVLRGWTEHGDRPLFGVVSGVSAGALAAPFAFLGPEYDGALQDIFTKLSAGDLYSGTGLGLFFGDSLYNTAPLVKLIRSYATDAFLDKIAAEHRKGRRLIVMTTDLDAERPVLWYLSAIAASERPDRRDLFVKVLMASSAVPGMFPPITIPVVASDHMVYDELHVDGGVTAEVVFVPPEMRLPDIETTVFGKPRSRNLYIIRNGKLRPEYAASTMTAISLATRAVSTMVKYQVIDNLRSLSADARATGTQLFYAAVPPSFDVLDRKPFDPAYAKRLYAAGRDMGQMGRWSDNVVMSPELIPK